MAVFRCSKIAANLAMFCCSNIANIAPNLTELIQLVFEGIYLLRKSPSDVGCLLGDMTGDFRDIDLPKTFSCSPGEVTLFCTEIKKNKTLSIA